MRISDWSSDVCSSDLLYQAARFAICALMTTPPLKAAIIPVTPLQQNCTLLWCTSTSKGAFVDPGGDLGRLKAAASQHGVERSEEHTSELQSLMRTSYAVFCLKKKQIKTHEEKE